VSRDFSLITRHRIGQFTTRSLTSFADANHRPAGLPFLPTMPDGDILGCHYSFGCWLALSLPTKLKAAITIASTPVRKVGSMQGAKYGL
jgi:hypothetical protein